MADDQSVQPPPRKGIARRLVIPLALAAAIGGGFVTGMLGGPLLFTPKGATSDAAIFQVDAGTFPIIMPGTETQMVGASVSIRSGASAPDGAGPLHDAVLALLTDASALPLVLDGRTALPDFEKIVMAMAQVSAPWLVTLHLEPGKAGH